MLYLSRKIGESIIINNEIEVTLVDVRGKTAKLGFTFPPSASVLRKELYDKIKQENIAAAGAGLDDLAAFELLGVGGSGDSQEEAEEKPQGKGGAARETEDQ